MNLLLDSLPSILTVMNTAVLSHLARPLPLDSVPEGQEPVGDGAVVEGSSEQFVSRWKGE